MAADIKTKQITPPTSTCDQRDVPQYIAHPCCMMYVIARTISVNQRAIISKRTCRYMMYHIKITFHRTHWIRLINDDHINVRQLQSLQTGTNTFDDMFARQATLFALGTPVNFRCDHIA